MIEIINLSCAVIFTKEWTIHEYVCKIPRGSAFQIPETAFCYVKYISRILESINAFSIKLCYTERNLFRNVNLHTKKWNKMTACLHEAESFAPYQTLDRGIFRIPEGTPDRTLKSTQTTFLEAHIATPAPHRSRWWVSHHRWVSLPPYPILMPEFARTRRT